MTGSLLQINISPGGAPKLPIPEGFVGPLGVEGDQHAHPQFHGGPRQAVLLIAAETYDRLQARGFPVFYGAFGENFTTRGIDPAGMRAGQRYRVGNVLIELTKVRTPCATLDVFRHPDGRPVQKEIYDAAVKAGDPSSPRWALSGFYASVLQPGLLFPGSPIVLLDHAV